MPTGLVFVTTFLACLEAGAIAVPAVPPRTAGDAERLTGIVDDCRPRLVLTAADPDGRTAALLAGRGVRCVAVDRLDTGTEPLPENRGPAVAGDAPALLQYTSGSTAAPRGVVVSHDNLLANEAMIQAGFGIAASDVGLSWLPIHHDMGLMGGLLAPLYVGGRSVLLQPASVLRRPIRWLEAIDRFRATMSGAPNFAYELCCAPGPDEAAAHLDLRHWRVAFCGAEPVRAATLERFAARFAAAGFDPAAFLPCYGLAEATLMVTGGGFRPVVAPFDSSALAAGRAEPHASGRPLVGCGEVPSGLTVRTVDPESRRPCPLGRIGEVWVAGPSVCRSYWGNPAATGETFGARLADDDGERYLRTGDLGFFERGNLFVTGRLKSTIIVRGRNHHAADIEWAASRSHGALRATGAAAFAVDDGTGERLVIVQEVERSFRGDWEVVARAVRAAVAEHHEVRIDEVVLTHDRLPRTTSNKIRRFAVREALANGRLTVVHRSVAAPAGSPAPAEVERGILRAEVSAAAPSERRRVVARFVCERIAALLGPDVAAELDPSRPLQEVGLDSLTGIQLRDALGRGADLDLPATFALERPTIDGIVRELLAGMDAAQRVAAAAGDGAVARSSGATPAGERAPIAVVGVACRLPGGATPEAFWETLESGIDTVAEVPAERWDLESLFDPRADRAGKLYSRWGGFLDVPIDAFDAAFFGLTPGEAAAMDPQHRLLLEVAWEALERAGIGAGELAGSATGVFAGLSTHDYETLLGRDLDRIDAHSGTGNAASAAVGRISYLLDLNGPALAVDTACSSSLMAVHLAVRSLRAGECSLALAGGVNLMLAPGPTVYSCRIRALAADGRAKSFDARADGYVRGEGCGVVVLKRLDDALAAGDRVVAVIRGSATNQDGRSAGLTAPSIRAQEAVILAALADAGLEPDLVDYVEAHGSGTALGDPIEARALGAVFATSGRRRPLAIGSVKTNVGHLEAAAGVAGLIKVVLALEHGRLPPSLHFRSPNPEIDLPGLCLEVQSRLTSWPEESGPSRAGVSSFGFAGSNVHVVLEAPPPARASGPARDWQVLPVSARTESALDQTCRDLAAWLARHSGDDAEASLLADVAASLQRRTAFEHRRVVVARSLEQACRALLDGEDEHALGRHARPGRRSLAFLLPGVGDHYLGMAGDLYRSEPVFRATVDASLDLLCAQGLDLRDLLVTAPASEGAAGTTLDLRAMLRGNARRAEPRARRLDRTVHAQPAVFVIDHALGRLLLGWGLEPEAMLGYSLGELVAATLAGVFALDDALRFVVERARRIEALPAGGMLAVPLAPDALAPHLQTAPAGTLFLAAVNGPNLSVAAGRPEALEDLARRLESDGVACRPLPTRHAFHTPLLEPVRGPLERLVRGFHLSPPRVPFLSNLTGRWITDSEATDPGYWAAHVTSPIRLADGLAALLEDPERSLVEVGPGQSLSSFARQHPACGADRAVAAALRSAFDRRDDRETLARALAQLWAAGTPVDWRAVSAHEERRRLVLPTYPFERRRFWFADPPEAGAAADPVDVEVAEVERVAGAAGWFYVPRWQPRTLETLPASRLDGQLWLLLGGERGFADALAAEYRARGAEVVQVEAGATFSGDGARFVMRPPEAADYRAFLDALAAEGRSPTGVVHLWCAGGGSEEETERGFLALLALARATGARLPGLRLAVVTTGLHAQGPGEAVLSERALVLGPAIVLPQEIPGWRAVAVDLAAADLTDPDTPARVVDEALSGRDPVVALRAGVRSVRVMAPRRLEAPTDASPPLREGGVYVITGGSGGLGLATAEALARRVRARLALVARTPLPPRESWRSMIDAEDPLAPRLRRLLEIEAAGGEVLALAADVADTHGLSAALAATVERFGAIHGVFHAAGVPGAGMAQLKSPEEALRVLRPKVEGARVLDEALRAVLADRPGLDFLVVFASLNGLLGGVGQVDYCAANAYLDAFAHARSARGERTLAIDWGPWRWDAWDRLPGGVPELQARHRELRRRFGLEDAEGTEALLRALAADEPQVAVSTVPLDAFARALERITPRSISELRPEPTAAGAPRSPRVRTPTNAPVPDWAGPASSRFEARIADLWRRALGAERVGPRDNFFDLGGNSLIGIQLVADLNRELGTAIEPVTLFEAPTVEALARTLRAREPAATRAVDIPAAPTRAAVRREGAIAVVGMAFRFPGAANAEQLWRLLRDGELAVTELSEEELLAQGVPADVLTDPAYVRRASVLENIDRFDAGLFGYTPREAEILDPQHRLFLECAWEALELAGCDPERFGGAIGVFAGTNLSTYLMQLMASPEATAAASPLQLALANEKDALPTTVSYKLDLRGPSVGVQTFCSTSLVATHLACRSLQDGDSDLALAGGVRVAVPHRVGYRYEEGGIEPPDGITRAFDAAGKGSILGNGVAVVVLKRLADALAEGDTVQAIIRGSAVNNDGALKAGYTAPSVERQAQAAIDALCAAGLSPDDISYLEAHGTGTALGDPIEIAALARAYAGRSGGRIPIGSVKTNFGHLDRAAGLAGLIKTVLAMRHRELPPSLGFERPNPNIEFARVPFEVNTELRPWENGRGPRRAAINSLGMGGTNAHVVLEEAPTPAPTSPSRKWQLLPLSAATPTALERLRLRLADHLERTRDLDLADVAHTLQTGRRQLAHRAVVVARDCEEAVRALRGEVAGALHEGVAADVRRPVVFLFPGLGDQYPGMAARLYREEPVFRAAVDHLCPLLGDLEEPVREALLIAPSRGEDGTTGATDLRRMLRRSETGAPGPFDRTEVAQPAVLVFELALAALLRAWGLVPDALVGYSLGEYAAAAVGGVQSDEAVVRLVAERARRIAELPAGSMLAVALSPAELGAQLEAHPGVVLAAVNGPGMTVAAGPPEAVARLRRSLAERQVACSGLRTTHAFHSPMLLPVAARLAAAVRDAAPGPPRIPVLSNLTGAWLLDAEAVDPSYWARHMCEPVAFGPALAALLEDPLRTLIEVGPGQTLTALARQHPDWDGDASRLAVATVPAEYTAGDAAAFLLTAIGRAWIGGVQIDWRGYRGGERRRRVPLPTYPFERRRYWIDAAPARPAAPHGGRIADPGSWYYLPFWAPAPLPPAAGRDDEARSWLVLADRRGVGDALAERLRATGGRVVTIAADPATGPADPAALERRVATLRPAPTRIVNLRPLDQSAPTGAEGTPMDLDSALAHGYRTLLALARALGDPGDDEPRAIWSVGEGLFRIYGSDRTRPELATLLGPTKVLPQELPGLRCAAVDVRTPPAGSWRFDRLVDQLLAEVTSSDGATAVGLRDGERRVERFERVHLPPAAGRPPLLRRQAVVVITGGLGAIGLSLAEHLTSMHGARIALVGRTPLPPRERWDEASAAAGEGDRVGERIRRLRALEEAAAEVQVFAADVAEPAELRAALAAVRERFGRIDGVVHAAGVTDPAAFVPARELDEITSELHFRPKVRGLLCLAEALRDEPLDFCLVQSSLSAVLGGLGFAAYAAANAFMDAWVERLEPRPGGPWICVDWDTWRAGAPAAGEGGRFGTTIEQYAMSHQEGLDAVERVLAFGRGGRLVSSTGDLGARLAQWIELRSEPAPDTPAHARPSLSRPYVAPETETERVIAAVWQEVLGVDRVGRHDDFFELGGHSLLATQVFARLRRSLALDLSLRTLFDGSTVEALGDAIETVRWAGSAAAAPVPGGAREEIEV